MKSKTAVATAADPASAPALSAPAPAPASAPANAGAWRHIAWGLALAAVFEALTVALRFGADLQSTRDTTFAAAFTFGLRIHHGYIGAACLLGTWLLRLPPAVRAAGWRLGIALVVSDLVHHFLVLWPITGDPQFHWTYH